MNDEIIWLQNWYLEQTNDEWEHQYGIKIDTIDNPGWTIQIDLKHTHYSKMSHDRIIVDKGDTDWYQCWIEKKQFHGASSPQHLVTMIIQFKEWVDSYTK